MSNNTFKLSVSPTLKEIPLEAAKEPYFRLLCWNPEDEDPAGVLDFKTKEAALAAFRVICEAITNPAEAIEYVEVYEMHDDKKESLSVCTFSWTH